MDKVEVVKKPIALIVSSGLLNPGVYPRFLLNRFLFSHKQFRFSGVPSVEKFPDLLMEKIAVVVLFFHARKITQEAAESLDWYIRQGGGVIAFLPALTSFSDSQVYTEIIGARGSVTDRVERMVVGSAAGQSPIFGSCSEFTILEKKPVMRLDPANEVHFSIKTGEGSLPYVWTRAYERGRITGIAASGAANSFQNPVLQKIISQSLDWCSNLSADVKIDNDY